MTRDEHLQWCKDRAMQYVREGKLREAFASMCSDLMKHEETKQHASTNKVGISLLGNGHLDTAEDMAKWIDGYN